ncbi:hypothetical protein [Thalassomonas actiniarum]|uniref:EF-hand domain-containing protein n=1 Tax=Thalassomonas actiniarum TaxID=485447 RepID=A0AAF0C6F8_9GAMM|nr:hypothetical protein [Thalassomonas actiniarum]WDE02221.1 hypothetical protein SG35_031180 [Thalassomonas actiniarum]
MPFITDKLFTNLDSKNIETEGEVEKATSYGVFNDLTDLKLLTSADLHRDLTGYDQNGTTTYTLEEYLTKTWQSTLSEFDGLTSDQRSEWEHNDQYEFEIATRRSNITSWDYDNQDYLRDAYHDLTKNGGAEITTKIKNNNNYGVDDIDSAKALLARAGINTEAEADQLIDNIIKIYDENGLTLADEKSHIFEVNKQVASDKAVKEDNAESIYYGEFFKNKQAKLVGYNDTDISVAVNISLDYDEILRAAFSFSNGSNGTNVPSKAQMGDSIFEYLYKKYNGDIGSGKIREDFTPASAQDPYRNLYRNLIPEAFNNSTALAAEADAKSMTGLDLIQLEYNYNVSHPDNQLHLSQDLWEGGVAPYKLLLAGTQQWQTTFANYPRTIPLTTIDTKTWNDFTTWVRAVDPNREYFKEDIRPIYTDGDYTLEAREFDAIDQHLSAYRASVQSMIDEINEHYLMKDRFMQSHRQYSTVKEKQYRDAADELSDMNKMLEEARKWQEWIGKFEREDKKGVHLSSSDNIAEFGKFYAWIVSSDVASPAENNHTAYIDWKKDYDSDGDQTLSDDELTTLYTDITNYQVSLENRGTMVSVDANQLLTRHNEAMEFLSSVLSRIMTSLKNVLRNMPG